VETDRLFGGSIPRFVRSMSRALWYHREYEGLTLRENLGLGAGLVEVVGGGIFCRQPACFCKSEATDRAPAGSTLAGRGKPNRSRRVFVS